MNFLKTAKSKTRKSSLIPPHTDLIEKLSERHGGQGSGVYAVMSNWIARRSVPRSEVRRAATELRRDSKSSNLSKRLQTEAANLANQLTRIANAVSGGKSAGSAARKLIVRAAARAAFTDHWVREQEYKAEETGRRPPWPRGANLEDYVPRKTPKSATVWAEKLIARVEKDSREDIVSMYDRLEAMSGHRRTPTPDLFGHYIAMEALGHGVSWSDDHPYEGLSVPNMDYYG